MTAWRMWDDDAEIARLLHLHASGMTNAEIGKEMGRARNSIRMKLIDLGLQPVKRGAGYGHIQPADEHEAAEPPIVDFNRGTLRTEIQPFPNPCVWWGASHG